MCLLLKLFCCARFVLHFVVTFWAYKMLREHHSINLTSRFKNLKSLAAYQKAVARLFQSIWSQLNSQPPVRQCLLKFLKDVISFVRSKKSAPAEAQEKRSKGFLRRPLGWPL